MTTVLDALRNAQYNFENVGRMGGNANPFFVIALDQLTNAVEALENDKKPSDVLQENMFSDVKTKE